MPSPETNNEKLIRLTFTYFDNIHMLIKFSANLTELKNAVCQRLALSTNIVRLCYRGAAIREYDTPEKLGMVDDDCIDVHVFDGPTGCALPPLTDDNYHIVLKCIWYDMETRFRVRRKAHLWKLKRAYANNRGVPGSTVRLRYKGAYIGDRDTVLKLGLEENDYLFVDA